MGKQTNIYIFDFEDRIKIGQSGNVKQRLRHIETQSGREAIQHFSIKADGNYENLMHKVLSEYRGVGEYFNFPFDFAVSILKSLVNFGFSKEIKADSQLFLPLVIEKTKIQNIPSIIINQKGYTISELSKELARRPGTIRQQLSVNGIEPILSENVYPLESLEILKKVLPRGRPPKKKP
jgi:hypothetical protein